jgi:hypothetical protein
MTQQLKVRDFPDEAGEGWMAKNHLSEPKTHPEPILSAPVVISPAENRA